MNFIQKKWINFDEKVMKPFFIKENKDDEVSNKSSLISNGKSKKLFPGLTEMIDRKLENK